MELTARLTNDRHGATIVEITSRGLGEGATLYAADLRQLAAVFAQLADEADARKATHRGRPMPDVRKRYVTR